MDTQLETILERDLRLLDNTTLGFSTLRNLLGFVAQHQGEPIKFTDAARATRIARPTIQKLFRVFEALFLIRSVPTEGGTGAKVYYMEDQGEASHLIGKRTDPLFDLTRFLYANLRLQAHYRFDAEGYLFCYRTRSNAEVPLCFRFLDKEIGIIPIAEANPNRSATASAQSFLKAYPKSHILFVNEGREIKKVSTRALIVPALALVIA